MAIWDEFSKKAGKTMRAIGERTKEVAEVTKLTNRIGVKTTELEKLFIEIGKEYMDVRDAGEKGSKELDKLCGDVRVLEAEIKDLQDMVDEIRQVRRCPVCGEVSPTTQRFCGSCGEKFAEKVPLRYEKTWDDDDDFEDTDDDVEINWPKAEKIKSDAIIVPETKTIDKPTEPKAEEAAEEPKAEEPEKTEPEQPAEEE